MNIDSTFWVVLAGLALLGFNAGMLGVFAFLRRQSLLADAISHASLPGIALSFIIKIGAPVAGAFFGGSLFACVAVVLIGSITRYTKLKYDTALGVVLSVAFGLGLILLTYIQQQGYEQQALIHKLFFGSAATLLLHEVGIFFLVVIGIWIICLTCWKEFALVLFDPEYAITLGYPVAALNSLLTFLLVIGIVMSLQAIGVVLVSSLFIAPALAARYWVKHFSSMIILAGLIGAVSGMASVLLSSIIDHLPTGPIMVILLSSVIFISLLKNAFFSANTTIATRSLINRHSLIK